MENVDILLVEDNPDDARLTIRALKQNNLSNHLIHVEDGEEAMAFLLSADRKSLPKLVILDMKMPKVDGVEVLRRMKNDETLKMIPVVMLTSSKEEQDLVNTYKLGVNAYIVKPVEFETFVKTVSDLGFFWMMHNEVPKIIPPK